MRAIGRSLVITAFAVASDPGARPDGPGVPGPPRDGPGVRGCRRPERGRAPGADPRSAQPGARHGAGVMAGGANDDRHALSRRRLLALAGVTGAGGVLVGSYVSGDRPLDGERDLALQTILPRSYRAGRDDVGPYVQEAMANLEPSGRASLLLPPGRHRWDSPCYFAADTQDL